MLIPGEIFRTYTRDLIRVELAKHHIILPAVLKRKLWASAEFDSYIVGQYKKPLLDGFGLPVEEAGEYAQIIQQALQEFKMGRTGA